MDGTRARATLGLCPDADLHDVKHRYRLLAKASHPDTGGDSAWFDALTQAYEIASATPPVRTQAHPFFLQMDAVPEPAPTAPRHPHRRVSRSFEDELRMAMAR